MSVPNLHLRRLSLLMAGLLVLMGCDDDGGGEPGTEPAGDEAPEDGSTDDDAPEGEPAEDDGPGDAAEEDGPVDADGGSGGGSGTVTVDGAVIAMDRTMLCDPPDEIGGRDSGEVLDEIGLTPMNLAATSDEGNLQVSLGAFVDLDMSTVNVTWTSSEATYTASFLDRDGSGVWLEEEGFEPAHHDPFQMAGDRASGRAVLEPFDAMSGPTGGEPIDLEFDLEVPTEVTC